MHHARQHAQTHQLTRTRERRHRLAHEAARLMAEGGIRDYHQATLKALVKAGASQALTDRQGNPPLLRAKQRGYDAMVQMLVSR